MREWCSPGAPEQSGGEIAGLERARAFPCLHSHPRAALPCVSAVERGQKISEQIVIGTPGTVLDWCSKLKFIDPKKIKVFVLDEADVMIATQGHQDQSIRIQR